MHVGKGQAKQGKIYVILLFLRSCVVLLELKCKKREQEEGKAPGDARALLSLNGKYNFYFRFGLCVL
jgi:hypothetical protein